MFCTKIRRTLQCFAFEVGWVYQLRVLYFVRIKWGFLVKFVKSIKASLGLENSSEAM